MTKILIHYCLVDLKTVAELHENMSGHISDGRVPGRHHKLSNTPECLFVLNLTHQWVPSITYEMGQSCRLFEWWEMDGLSVC